MSDPECVSGERFAAALNQRQPDLWQTNRRMAERIEMRIKEALHNHIHAHGSDSEAQRCVAARLVRHQA